MTANIGCGETDGEFRKRSLDYDARDKTPMPTEGQVEIRVGGISFTGEGSEVG
jgi:hypothetical protein